MSGEAAKEDDYDKNRLDSSPQTQDYDNEVADEREPCYGYNNNEAAVIVNDNVAPDLEVYPAEEIDEFTLHYNNDADLRTALEAYNVDSLTLEQRQQIIDVYK